MYHNHDAHNKCNHFLLLIALIKSKVLHGYLFESVPIYVSNPLTSDVFLTQTTCPTTPSRTDLLRLKQRSTSDFNANPQKLMESSDLKRYFKITSSCPPLSVRPTRLHPGSIHMRGFPFFHTSIESSICRAKF